MLASKAVLPILGAVLGVAVGAAYATGFRAFEWEAILNATEFWAAILGATVGGAISFALQIRSFDEARRTRENEEQQKDAA